MKKILLSLVVAALAQTSVFASTSGDYYATKLCSHPNYECVKVKGGKSWAAMFPDERQRDVVQRVNRTYNYLWGGKTLAIPKNIENITLFDVSPFPLAIKPEGEKQVIIDQEKLAWAAYDAEGKLVKWGPISSGKDYCPDIGQRCRTQTGVFRIFGKQNKRCRSRAFNANMPWCMFFYKGFALHGSHDIPGKRASHGCIRMFKHDAKWLNQEFVNVSNEYNEYKGTKVVVQALHDDLHVRTKR